MAIPNFLDTVLLTDDERAKLLALGSPTPMALLAMRASSKEAFDGYVGRPRVDAIASDLEKLLTPEERLTLRTSTPIVRSMGARLDRPPSKS